VKCKGASLPAFGEPVFDDLNNVNDDAVRAPGGQPGENGGIEDTRRRASILSAAGCRTAARYGF